ncbi:MAG TPA: hypothetical protein VIU61_00985, partial [Kofleriaceae bacterium]
TLKAVLALALVACSPSMPTEEAAKQALAAREAKIERVKGMIATELGRDTLESTGKSPGQRASERADAIKDLNARLRNVLEPAVTEVGALGLQLSLYPGADRTQSLGVIHFPPCRPGQKNGSHEPKDGLGWGLYQTSYEDDTGKYGNGDYHPGIIVVRDVVANGVTAELMLCFLTDGTPRPAPPR